MDWSAGWLDELQGETHLLIPPNSEHSLATGIPEIIDSLSAFLTSVAAGEPASARPSFTYAHDADTGELSVTIPDGLAHGKVVLRSAETLQSERRDFRWARARDSSALLLLCPFAPLLLCVSACLLLCCSSASAYLSCFASVRRSASTTTPPTRRAARCPA